MSAMRKIGYSFLGLLAGNIALFTFLFVDAKAWQMRDMGAALEIYLFYLAFSLFGWIIVGIPFVLVISSEVIVELNWLIVVLIGLFLGALAQSLIFLWFGVTGHLNFPVHWGDVLAYEKLAMVISAVAFVVYCALARRTLRQQ